MLFQYDDILYISQIEKGIKGLDVVVAFEQMGRILLQYEMEVQSIEEASITEKKGIITCMKLADF